LDKKIPARGETPPSRLAVAIRPFLPCIRSKLERLDLYDNGALDHHIEALPGDIRALVRNANAYLANDLDSAERELVLHGTGIHRLIEAVAKGVERSYNTAMISPVSSKCGIPVEP
jgi:hypothetical protein